ncbi:MAG: histidine--tRNA ligase [Rhodospirillaceae bacterium]|nr:histidine--tRNA ligase [Rhodospirillaceae bacterium]
MSKLQPIRGTHDLLPDAMRRHSHVVNTAAAVAGRYGYDAMATPVFEATEVFARTLGETSDVVTKEMYSFETKGGDSVTLRPENTAGVARAVISNGLHQSVPLRYFYAGPMFRHERPQMGRQRQFHQIGIELIGVAHPLGDVETIAAGAAVLDALEVRDRTILELNTLGDTESRAAYRDRLVGYLSRFKDELSEDSRRRLDLNPLRILDSKNARDREIVAGAPVFGDSLTEGARAWFDAVKAGLDAIGIAYTLNERLVRGLDYYCHSAFEFTTDALGAQGAVTAGGRYAGLIGRRGGPDAPGVGWAGGIERLALLAEADLPAPRPVALVPIGEAAETAALALAERLRAAGYRIDMAFDGNLKKRMKRADRIGARAAVLIGTDELAEGAATVRDLDSGEQGRAPLDTLAEALTPFR